MANGCESCGKVYGEGVDPDPDMSVEDWLGCFTLPQYLAEIPAGHILTIAGREVWIDGEGRRLSRSEYIAYHNVDPEVAWKAKKEYLKIHGGGVHYIK